jgi:hypothetical protein
MNNQPMNNNQSNKARFSKKEIETALKNIAKHLAREDVQAEIKKVLDDATARIEAESKK